MTSKIVVFSPIGILAAVLLGASLYNYSLCLMRACAFLATFVIFGLVFRLISGVLPGAQTRPAVPPAVSYENMGE